MKAHSLFSLFRRNDCGDFVAVKADYHTLFGEKDGALENAGVLLDEAGQLSDGQIIKLVTDQSIRLGTGGNDVFSSVLAAGKKIANLGVLKKVRKDVLFYIVDVVVLKPLSGFPAACTSW